MGPGSSRTTGTSASGDDHRKRRRNRPTQSCLPCHISKRKCDRRRPCRRCTQLGNTGFCAYEIDEPWVRVEDVDDKMYHQRRMAERQGVIRELYQWSSQLPSNISEGLQGDTPNAPTTPASPAEHLSSLMTPHVDSENVGLQSPLLDAPRSIPTCRRPPWAPSWEGALATRSFEELFPIDLFNAGLKSYSTSTSSILAPSNIASAFSSASLAEENLTLQPSFLSSADPQSDLSLANFWGSTSHKITHDVVPSNNLWFEHQTRIEECNCFSEAGNRYAVLELSRALRRATDILSRYPPHNECSICHLMQHVRDLYALISATLESVDTTDKSGSRQAQNTQFSEVGHNLSGPAGVSVAYSVSPAYSETFSTPSYNSQMSWTLQQPWNPPTSSMPSLETNRGYN